MKSTWKKDCITGIVTIALFLLYYSQTFSIRQTTLIKLTSTFIPRLCVVLGVAFGAIILFKALVARKLEKASETVAAPEKTQADREAAISVWISFALLFLAIYIMKSIGFFYGGAFYLMGFFILCSRHIKRNWVLYVILAVVAPALIYLAFARGFRLRLSPGILGLLGGIL